MKDIIEAIQTKYPRVSHYVVRFNLDTTIFLAARSEKGEVLASTTADSLEGAFSALVEPE